MAESARITMPSGEDKPAIVNQLSVGGARIQTTLPLRAGDSIQIALDDGTEPYQKITARVVYSVRDNPSHHFASGLCFLGLQPLETQRLAAYITAEQTRRRLSIAQLNQSDGAEA